MTLYLVLVLALLLGVSEQQQNSTTAAESLTCTPPFTVVGDVCLYVDPVTSGTWYEMREYCQGLGGDLVSLHDANHFADLLQYIRSQGWPETSYWVGGTDEDHEGIWLWLDGTTMEMGPPFWAYNSNYEQLPTGSTSYNCAVLYGMYHNYMQDVGCAYTVPHPVCEQP